MEGVGNNINFHRFDKTKRFSSFQNNLYWPVIITLKFNTTKFNPLNSTLHIRFNLLNSFYYNDYQGAIIDPEQIQHPNDQTLLDGTKARLDNFSHFEIGKNLSDEHLPISHHRNFPLKLVILKCVPPT